jgi:S-adenosylmethionine decarboxylase
VRLVQGLHITADLLRCRCDAAWLTQGERLSAWCIAAVRAAGLQPVDHLFHAFPATARGPGGVTATVLLAESHLCLHTWPELGTVTADVYVCNAWADHSAGARRLLAALVDRFQPETVQQREVSRAAIAAAS